MRDIFLLLQTLEKKTFKIALVQSFSLQIKNCNFVKRHNSDRTENLNWKLYVSGITLQVY